MEYSDKEYRELQNQLDEKLKKNLDTIAFLELNKDITLNRSIEVKKDVPLPIKSRYLIEGIKNNEYYDSIKLDNIIESVIYVIGCDRHFKYNDIYIKLLKTIDSNIENVVLKKALEFVERGQFNEALILFRALDCIAPGKKEIKCDIALAFKELAAQKEEQSSTEHKFYNKLAFYEFARLTEQYPEFFTAYYHLGFFYSIDGEYEKALELWQKALNLCRDEEQCREISKLIESIKDTMDFEKGKRFVLEDNIIGGLRLLIPLLHKYGSWSEAKYYAALAYRKSENYKKAEMLFKELIDEGEELPEVYNELGLCSYNLGNMKMAVEYLNNAVKLNGEDTGFLCNLAIAYYGAGDTQKAKEYISKAYSINPRDEITIKCKIWADSIK